VKSPLALDRLPTNRVRPTGLLRRLRAAQTLNSFLAGFAILPIRAVLYILSDNSFWLIGVQVLDGVGAGIFGALTPLVIADIMRGTGRYNLAQGAIATVQGIGASLSGLAGGVIVDHFGYSAAFLAAGGAAFVALVVFALRMPETADRETPVA
jgi:MFS family permease